MLTTIGWENAMPLLRFSQYSQNVNLYLAPTADARDTWLSLMRTIGFESRAFVLSANQCQKRKHLPEWISGNGKTSHLPNGDDSHVSKASTRRRRSTVTVREHEHELVLPSVPESSSPAIDDSPEDQPTKASNLPANAFATDIDASAEEYVSRGGSCIVGPQGQVLKEPLWEVEDGGLLIVDADFEDCERGRLDLDVAGSYSRNDAFKLTVEGLDLNPPP